MHRFVWDLAWSGAGAANTEESEGDEEDGAPHGPRVVPGKYDVKLTVDGKTLTQPSTVVMDPRSVATAMELQQQYELGRKIFSETVAVQKALAEIHSVQKRLATLTEEEKLQQPELKSAVSQLQDAIKKILAASGVRSGDATGAVADGLETASAGITSALQVVESGDRTVPSQAIAVFEESDRAAKSRMDEWNRVKTVDLVQLNDQLKQAKEKPVSAGEN